MPAQYRMISSIWCHIPMTTRQFRRFGHAHISVIDFKQGSVSRTTLFHQPHLRFKLRWSGIDHQDEKFVAGRGGRNSYDIDPTPWHFFCLVLVWSGPSGPRVQCINWAALVYLGAAVSSSSRLTWKLSGTPAGKRFAPQRTQTPHPGRQQICRTSRRTLRTSPTVWSPYHQQSGTAIAPSHV